MIYTLTGNLLWERTMIFDSWTPGRTHRARGEAVQVGGKGINVAKMLRRLDHPVTALCFAGGATGEQCLAWLRQREIPVHAFRTADPTRIGLVVRASDQPETTFLGTDAPPDSAALAQCTAFLDACPDGSVLSFCGSFPGWDRPETQPLRDALDRWTIRCRLFADTYGPPLRWLVDRPIEAAKINRAEFEGLFAQAATHSTSMEVRLEEARKRFSARQWIVTDGPGSVWVAAAGEVSTVLQPPEVEEVSPTGSGDVLLACVLHAIAERRMSLTEAVALALPYAAANAASPGIAEFDLNIPSGSRSVPL